MDYVSNPLMWMTTDGKIISHVSLIQVDVCNIQFVIDCITWQVSIFENFLSSTFIASLF